MTGRKPIAVGSTSSSLATASTIPADKASAPPYRRAVVIASIADRGVSFDCTNALADTGQDRMSASGGQKKPRSPRMMR